MKIGQPLLKLPRRYCSETLAAEIGALPQSAWLPHPGRIVGNDAVPLITPQGEITNAFAGPMAPTEHLKSCPYIMEILADLGAVWGRSRLMGLAPGAVVPEHVDVGYYWRTHFRIHIPVVTTPDVLFTCEGETVHMKAGECWIFDSFRTHDVRNGGPDKRIHLVLDTVGGETLWELMRAGESGQDADALPVPPGANASGNLSFEHVNAPEIMSVWEVRCHIDFLLEQVPAVPALDAVALQLDRFKIAWGAAWARFGVKSDGIPEYARLLQAVRADLGRLGADRILLPNGVKLDRALNELIFMVALPSSAGAH
jgi:hypothetical protein